MSDWRKRWTANLGGPFRRNLREQMAKTSEMLAFLAQHREPAHFPAAADAIRTRFRLYSRGIRNVWGRQDPEQRAAELETYRQHLEELVDVRTNALLLAKDAAEEASRAKSIFLANILKAPNWLRI